MTDFQQQTLLKTHRLMVGLQIVHLLLYNMATCLPAKVCEITQNGSISFFSTSQLLVYILGLIL